MSSIAQLRACPAERAWARHLPRWLAIAVAVMLVLPKYGHAQSAAVPVSLQAELLAKVAEYDRNFVERAHGRAHVLIVAKGGDADSMRVGKQMETALSRLDAIAGLPHDETVYAFTNAADVAALCRTRGIAIVFFAPGFGDDIPAIRKALTDVNVLTAGSNPEYVANGIVLGFDVVSGRPKLLVHLPQARAQKVDLRSEVLKLMKVFE